MIFTDSLHYFSGGYLFREEGYTSSETLIEELSQYSPCKALLEEAQKSIQESRLPPLEVRFEPTRSGFNAERCNNIITIKPNLNAAKQRNSLLFELTNIIQHKEHIREWCSLYKGLYDDPEEFARAKESIEYNGVKRTAVVSRLVNKEKGRFFRSYIENKWERYPVESMDFDLYYSSYLSDNHKEYYRKICRDLNNIQNPNTQNPASNIFNNALKIALGVSVIAIAFFSCG